MSFFRKAAGLFVELPEETKAATATRMVPLPGYVQSAATRSPAATPLSPELVDKFAAHFDKLFDESNLPGPDYYEFEKAVDALEAHIPTEEGRMKAAFASYQVQGLTKEKLVATAKQYVAIVEAERKEFEAAANAEVEASVKPMIAAMREAQQALDQDQLAIANLQKGLKAKQEAVEHAREAHRQAELKLNENTRGYQTACEAMIARINGDINLINTTL